MDSRSSRPLLLLAVLLTCVPPVPGMAQDWQRFWPSSPVIPSGNDARSVVTGDFDEDGHADLITANDTGFDIAFISGAGDGSFALPDRFDIGATPRSIVSGDFDEDGHLDLASANVGIHANTVSILLGTGTGAFSDPDFYAVGSGPDAITSGDFDGDGHADLAVSHWFSDDVAVLLGTGTGFFSPASFQAAGDHPTGIDHGDFNEDGIEDLAVSDREQRAIALLFGDGTGAFFPPAFVSVTDSLTGLAVGDFDEDGHRDIAAISDFGEYTNRDVLVLLGTGNGLFSPPAYISVPGVPNAITIGDLDEDAHQDLVLTEGTPGVSILRGRGDGGFRSPEDYPTTPSPDCSAIGDFDEDGHFDLAVVGGYGLSPDYAAILLGDGTGGFAGAPRSDAGQSVTLLTSADFNEDGHLDLASLYRYAAGDNVLILMGDGEGSFQAPLSTGVNIYDPVSMVAADFDNDHHVDLAVVARTYYLSPNLYVYLGRGDGTFAHVVTLPSGRYTIGLASGDFDADGNVDLVTINESGDAVSVLIGEGNGIFSDPTSYAISGVPTDIVLDDFDGDGHVDLAVTAENGAGLAMFRGLGDGTFSDAVMHPYGGDLWSAVSADVDDDGHLDLLATDPARDELVFFAGDGSGGFAPPVEVALDPGLASIVAADFNRDGFPDLAGTFGNSVSVLFGIGPALFDAQNFVTSGGVTSLVAGDFDEDAFPDVAAGHRYSDDVAVLLARREEIDVDIACGRDTIPPGGLLPLTVGLENRTDSLITVDLMLRVHGIPGPDISPGPRRQTMAPGAEVTLSPSFMLPGGVPARTYIVSLEARALDGRWIDEDSFRVMVSGTIVAGSGTPAAPGEPPPRGW